MMIVLPTGNPEADTCALQAACDQTDVVAVGPGVFALARPLRLKTAVTLVEMQA